MIVVAVSAFVLLAQARGEENRGSASHMLPLCNDWLKLNENALQARKIDAARLTTAGMCAGVVVGIVEVLRTLSLSCPPNGVTNFQLVRMVVNEIKKHPEGLHEDFVVPASAVFISAWPCPERK